MKNCLMCGKPFEGLGNICPACTEKMLNSMLGAVAKEGATADMPLSEAAEKLQGKAVTFNTPN